MEIHLAPYCHCYKMVVTLQKSWSQVKINFQYFRLRKALRQECEYKYFIRDLIIEAQRAGTRQATAVGIWSSEP